MLSALHVTFSIDSW